jgi:PAS domain S-box-containing protein
MSPERILVIDDDREVAAFMAQFLESRGFEVSVAYTGRSGLDELARGRVGLLLLDIRLPDMTGIQVMEELPALPSPPEIIVVTGEATLDSAIKAVEGGTAGYLLKPVDPARLEPIVRRIWDRRRLVRENARLQDEMAARLRETEAVLSIAHTASTTLDVQEALRRICRELTRLIGADTAAAYLLDPGSPRLMPCAGYRVPKDMLATLMAFPLPVGKEGFEEVWETRRPVFSDNVPSDPRFGYQLFKLFRHQSSLVLPLFLDDKVAGAFYLVWWTKRKVLSDREMALVEHVASQVTVVLRHARLFEQAQRERKQLGVLYEISRRLAAVEDAERVLSLLIEETTEILGVDAAGIRLREGDELVASARTRSAARLMARPRIRLDEGLSGVVAATGRPVMIEDLRRDTEHQPAHKAAAIEEGFQSVLGVPLTISTGTIGCLLVWSKRRRRFSAEDTSLLTALGDHAALAVHKARLYAESRAREQEATKLYEVASHLTATLEVDSVLAQIVAKTMELLACDASGVFVPDEAIGGLRFRAGRNLTPGHTQDFVLSLGEGVAGRAFQERRPVSTSDRLTDTTLIFGPAADRVSRQGPRAFLAVPIVVRDEGLGVLVAYFFEPHQFTGKEEQLLSTLAAHAGIAMDNARHYEKVRFEQNRLAQIFDSTSDGMMLVAPNGQVETANRRAADMLGLEAAELGGVELTDLLAGQRMEGADYPRMFAALRSLVEDPEHGGEGDLELAALRRVLHWVSQPTKDAAGATCGFTLTLQDVTHEREVSQMKSDFVSFVTHQLRTPLAGIKWMLELAAQEPEMPADAGSYVQDAREAAQRLIQLVNDLLDISRLERGRLTVTLVAVDLGELTRDVLAELDVLVREKRHRVTLTGDVETPAVQGDAQLLRQVVGNLISNAIKYTPEGGTIEIHLARGDGMVRWSVRDSGIGIPVTSQARLFEKFYRAENVTALETEGTGLGLYLVRLIMEQLGGRVWCASEEGSGATFLFTLPAGEAA